MWPGLYLALCVRRTSRRAAGIHRRARPLRRAAQAQLHHFDGVVRHQADRAQPHRGLRGVWTRRLQRRPAGGLLRVLLADARASPTTTMDRSPYAPRRSARWPRRPPARRTKMPQAGAAVLARQVQRERAQRRRICPVPTLSPTHLKLPALPAVADDPTTEDDDESFPGQDAVDITLTWSDVKVYVTAAVIRHDRSKPRSPTRASHRRERAAPSATRRSACPRQSPVRSSTWTMHQSRTRTAARGGPTLCDSEANPELGRFTGSGISPNTRFDAIPASATACSRATRSRPCCERLHRQQGDDHHAWNSALDLPHFDRGSTSDRAACSRGRLPAGHKTSQRARPSLYQTPRLPCHRRLTLSAAAPVSAVRTGPGAAPYILWGASVVSLGLGTAFGVMALGAQHDYDERPPTTTRTRYTTLASPRTWASDSACCWRSPAPCSISPTAAPRARSRPVCRLEIAQVEPELPSPSCAWLHSLATTYKVAPCAAL